MSSDAFRMFLAVLLIAVLVLTAVVTRYEYDSHVRYDRWTGKVDMPMDRPVAKENRFLK